MKINDWYEVQLPYHINAFSANDVPWPLDEWLKLQGKPTTGEIAKLVKNWYLINDRKKRR